MGFGRASSFGPAATLIFFGFTGYTIVKKELFGIKVVLTALLVVLISILLLLDGLIFSQNMIDKAAKFLILIVFLYFGYMLIKSVQSEIRQREKMEKMAQELKGAYERVKELDRSKSEFLSIASHQLRTPLTAINGYLSMVLEGTYGKISDKAKRPLSNVFRASRQLNQLVNTLLSLSRIEAGKITLEAKPMSLEKILKRIVEEFEVVAREKGLYLKLDIPSPLPLIPLDEEKINQVIMNLVDNSIKYTQKGGIVIKCKMKNEKLKIEIMDTGMGMNKEHLGQLFEKFSRGRAGQESWGGGTGLGLFIAKKFVELHKGKVWAESEGVNKGSVFSIELPIN